MLLTWLLAAALPLQGVAAARMACGPGPEADAPVVVASAPDKVVAAHMHDMSSVGPAAHHHQHVMATAVEHDEDEQPVHGTKHSSKCSLCASCCTSAAPPALSFTLEPDTNP